MSLVKFFPVDKIIVNNLGDVVSAPVKTICHAIEEKLNVKRELEKQAGALEMEDKRIISEIEKKQKLAEIDANIRRWNEEINDFVAQKEIERNKKILDAIMEYQRTMLEDYASIMSNISAMELRLADEAHKYIADRTRDYMNLQKEARQEFFDEIRMAQELYPDNMEMQNPLIEMAREQRMSILHSSQEMISMLRNDMSRIVEKGSGRMDVAAQFTHELLGKWGQGVGISNIS